MLSERLRFLRESMGMTQIELAKKIDVAPTTYRNYENTTREPNYDTLVKIKNRTEVYARESRYYKNVTVMFDFNPVNGF